MFAWPIVFKKIPWILATFWSIKIKLAKYVFAHSTPLGAVNLNNIL